MMSARRPIKGLTLRQNLKHQFDLRKGTSLTLVRDSSAV